VKHRLPWLRPDGKSQVSVAYEGDEAVGVKTVVISTQHAGEVNGRELKHGTIREAVIEEVVKPVLKAEGLSTDGVKFLIHPTGRFVTGGPKGDAGLTGRKIIVDTYGGMARHGGGAFSGKDPSKVDRSAAYATRWVAKNIVEAKLARRCEVQIAYAIGVARPVSIMVQTFGTGVLPDARLERIVDEVFDLTPKGIIDALKLKRPIYSQTAAYGHFGRRPFSGTYRDDGKQHKVDYFTWEETNRVKDLLSAAR
jgi:S-adenosylmethionine synthetase